MAKILNFGSLNLDYVYTVDHFVRPGETITSFARNVNCGGKGLNQSIALSKAGADVYHAGRIGSDGGMLLDTLASQNVNTDLVFREEDVPSGHAIIQVDKSGQNSIILYPGANSRVDSAMTDRVLEGFSEGDYLVLQNEINDLPEIMEKAHRKGLFIVLNPSPITDELLSYPLEYVSLLIVNEIEGEALSGENRPSRILTKLRKKYGADVLLTLGSSGAMYYGGGKVV
ncbi:MAG: ribokinase, partial [Clostridia bacterium]|nr:ribokinase [Clostridia bacterium]